MATRGSKFGRGIREFGRQFAHESGRIPRALGGFLGDVSTPILEDDTAARFRAKQRRAAAQRAAAKPAASSFLGGPPPTITPDVGNVATPREVSARQLREGVGGLGLTPEQERTGRPFIAAAVDPSGSPVSDVVTNVPGVAGSPVDDSTFLGARPVEDRGFIGRHEPVRPSAASVAALARQKESQAARTMEGRQEIADRPRLEAEREDIQRQEREQLQTQVDGAVAEAAAGNGAALAAVGVQIRQLEATDRATAAKLKGTILKGAVDAFTAKMETLDRGEDPPDIAEWIKQFFDAAGVDMAATGAVPAPEVAPIGDAQAATEGLVDLNGDGELSAEETEYNRIASLIKEKNDILPADLKRFKNRMAELEETLGLRVNAARG